MSCSRSRACSGRSALSGAAAAVQSSQAITLAAVQAVFDQPELHVELSFEAGQIQYVNNRATGHARTEFVDHPEPEKKRHLVRLWLRDEGKRGYRG